MKDSFYVNPKLIPIFKRQYTTLKNKGIKWNYYLLEGRFYKIAPKYKTRACLGAYENLYSQAFPIKGGD